MKTVNNRVVNLMLVEVASLLMIKEVVQRLTVTLRRMLLLIYLQLYKRLPLVLRQRYN